MCGSTSSAKQATLPDTQGIFYVFLVLLTLSTLVFVLEILIHRIQEYFPSVEYVNGIHSVTHVLYWLTGMRDFSKQKGIYKVGPSSENVSAMLRVGQMGSGISTNISSKDAPTKTLKSNYSYLNLRNVPNGPTSTGQYGIVPDNHNSSTTGGQARSHWKVLKNVKDVGPLVFKNAIKRT